MTSTEFANNAAVDYKGKEFLRKLLEHRHVDFYNRILAFADGESVEFSDIEMGALQQENFAELPNRYADIEGQPTDYVKHMARLINDAGGFLVLGADKPGIQEDPNVVLNA